MPTPPAHRLVTFAIPSALKATATAYANIALIKYWGKQDAAMNLPAAGSISATLKPLQTTSTVEWDVGDEDVCFLNDVRATGRDLERVSRFLDLVRDLSGIKASARVTSINAFPTAAGLASSASGFAALAVAATASANLQLDDQELSRLARVGSGSAARSIHGGFVRMHAGSPEQPDQAFAEQIVPASHWDLRVVLALTAKGRKQVSSTAGMNLTQRTSPYFDAWVRSVEAALPKAEDVIRRRDFSALAVLAEASALQMHASALAATPGVIYWNGSTIDVLHEVRRMRDEEGVEAFFTIDAGPHVKVFTTPDHEAYVAEALRAIPGVHDTLSASMGGPASLRTDHLVPPNSNVSGGDR